MAQAVLVTVFLECAKDVVVQMRGSNTGTAGRRQTQLCWAGVRQPDKDAVAVSYAVSVFSDDEGACTSFRRVPEAAPRMWVTVTVPRS